MRKNDGDMIDSDFNSLVVCAFRYALERSTYVVQEISDLIMRHLSQLSIETKDIIAREIDMALSRRSISMNMDRDEWVKLREAIKNDKV